MISYSGRDLRGACRMERWSAQPGCYGGGGGGAVIVILRLAAPESLAASPGSQISCIPFRLWDDALTASGAKTQSPSFFLK